MTYHTATLETPVITDKPHTLPKEGYTRLMPLAHYLGVHHHTIRRWLKADQMPQPKHINGLMLFENSKIHEWLESKTAGKITDLKQQQAKQDTKQ